MEHTLRHYITDITKASSECKTESKYNDSLAKAPQKQFKLNCTTQVLIPPFLAN
jgi:hypothetical protein